MSSFMALNHEDSSYSITQYLGNLCNPSSSQRKILVTVFAFQELILHKYTFLITHLTFSDSLSDMGKINHLWKMSKCLCLSRCSQHWIIQFFCWLHRRLNTVRSEACTLYHSCHILISFSSKNKCSMLLIAYIHSTLSHYLPEAGHGWELLTSLWYLSPSPYCVHIHYIIVKSSLFLQLDSTRNKEIRLYFVLTEKGNNQTVTATCKGKIGNFLKTILPSSYTIYLIVLQLWGAYPHMYCSMFTPEKGQNSQTQHKTETRYGWFTFLSVLWVDTIVPQCYGQ